jgi:hypothetical protein
MKIYNTEKLKELHNHALELQRLGDYFNSTLRRFHASDFSDSGVRAFDKCVDLSVVACVGEALGLENYVETFGSLRVGEGFIVDLLFELVYRQLEFDTFMYELTRLVSAIKDAGIVLVEVECDDALKEVV